MANVERKFRMVDINLLTSGLAYQRPIDEGFVAEKVSCFDMNLVEPICVSFRDGRYYVVDGQHTIAILKNKEFNKAYCEVRSGLMVEDENAWFYSKETKHRKQSTNRLLNARYFSGIDSKLNSLVQYLGVVGYKLKTVDVKNSEGVINASETIESIFNTMENIDFLKYITLHQSTWNGEKKSLQATFLRGLSVFYTTYYSEIDEKRFIKVFSKSANKNAKSPQDLLQEASRDIDTKDVNIKLAKVLVRTYNYNMRSGNPLKISKLED